MRQSKREDMPSHAFLVPGEKKYPVKVKDPKTGRWVLDANLLLAAQRRAVTQRRRDLASKAKSMRERLTGGAKKK
ncbi:MAG: hypothetical protein GWN64_17590 [Candidatus Thorarchaeota archaeon]|nr:hypothetical protein [Candidatus Thorarchaeota archaeon]